MRARALSLHQPYADWVRDGSKTIETRYWATSYRGDLVIASTKQVSDAPGPRGVTLCIVELYDVRPMTRADEPAARIAYDSRLWAWCIRNLRPVEPLSIRGRQRIYWTDVPPTFPLNEPPSLLFE